MEGALNSINPEDDFFSDAFLPVDSMLGPNYPDHTHPTNADSFSHAGYSNETQNPLLREQNSTNLNPAADSSWSDFVADAPWNRDAPRNPVSSQEETNALSRDNVLSGRLADSGTGDSLASSVYPQYLPIGYQAMPSGATPQAPYISDGRMAGLSYCCSFDLDLNEAFVRSTDVTFGSGSTLEEGLLESPDQPRVQRLSSPSTTGAG